MRFHELEKSFHQELLNVMLKQKLIKENILEKKIEIMKVKSQSIWYRKNLGTKRVQTLKKFLIFTRNLSNA